MLWISNPPNPSDRRLSSDTALLLAQISDDRGMPILNESFLLYRVSLNSQMLGDSGAPKTEIEKIFAWPAAR